MGADARLDIARQTLAARRQALYFATRRAKAGYTSVLELQQAQAEYHATEQLVPQSELAVATQEHALAILLGARSWWTRPARASRPRPSRAVRAG